MRKIIRKINRTNIKKGVALALCAVMAAGSTSLAKNVGDIDNVKVVAGKGDVFCSAEIKDVDYRNGVVNLKSDNGNSLIAFKMVKTVDGVKQTFGSAVIHEGNRKEFTNTGLHNTRYALWISLADDKAKQAYVNGSWSPDVR